MVPSAVDQLADAHPALRPLAELAVHADEATVRARAAEEIARLLALLDEPSKLPVLDSPRERFRSQFRQVDFVRCALDGLLDHLNASCEGLRVDEELMSKLRWCAGRVLSHHVALDRASRIAR